MADLHTFNYPFVDFNVTSVSAFHKYIFYVPCIFQENHRNQNTQSLCVDSPEFMILYMYVF